MTDDHESLSEADPLPPKMQLALAELNASHALRGAVMPDGLSELLGSLRKVEILRGSCSAFGAQTPWAPACGDLQLVIKALRGIAWGLGPDANIINNTLASILLTATELVDRLVLIIATYGPSDPVCWALWRPVYELALDSQVIHLGGLEFPDPDDPKHQPSQREQVLFSKDADSRSDEMAKRYQLNDLASEYYVLKALREWLEAPGNTKFNFAKGLEHALNDPGRSPDVDLGDYYLNKVREQEKVLNDARAKAFEVFYEVPPNRRDSSKRPGPFEWAAPGRVHSNGKNVGSVKGDAVRLRRPSREYALESIDAQLSLTGTDRALSPREAFFALSSNAVHGKARGQTASALEIASPAQLFVQLGLDLELIASTLDSSSTNNFLEAFRSLTSSIMDQVNMTHVDPLA